MKLKTSFFNATLYKKNLTRFWPLWGLTAFFAALMPISGIMIYLNGGLDADALDFAEAYYAGVCYFSPAVNLCYAILCAMAVWGYLYNARSVGMMHTLPIRREALFVTNFLSGLTMLAIPWAVLGVLSVILSIMCGAFSAGPLFLTILCVFAEGFLYFSSATAAAFVTGNIFALPALYFLLHFLAPLLDALITQFSANMIFGLRSRFYTGVVNWLSPTVFIIERLDLNRVYADVPVPGQPNVTVSELQSVTLENAWMVIAYALAVGLALLGAAYLLYRRRQSECAGEVIAMNWGRPVFRYGIAALLALGGGQLLYIIIFNSFDLDQDTYRLLPLIFCTILAGAIGYYGASMLLAKTLRVFDKKRLRGLAYVAAGCVVVCCLVGLDLLGVAKRVPSADDVNYIRLYTANNTYYLFPGEDADVIERLRDVHKAIVAEKSYISETRRRNPEREDYSTATNVSFRVCYYLKNGLTVDRNYFLYLTKERMEEPGTYDNTLDAFVNSTEMKLRRLRFNDPRFIVDSGMLSIQKRDKGYEFSSREQEEILSAIAADAKAGAWGQYDWFDEDNVTYAVSMSFWYSINDVNQLSQNGTDYINIYLRPGMDNTIAALKKMGYLEDGDLVTQSEMRRIWEEGDRRKFVMEESDESLLVAMEETFYPTDEVVSEAAAIFPATVPAEPAEIPESATAEPVTPDGANSAPQTLEESSAASIG